MFFARVYSYPKHDPCSYETFPSSSCCSNNRKPQKAGFEAYIVGGCVRDMLLKRVPKDWDITTNAKPEQIQEIFPDHVYENTFGKMHIGVKVDCFHPLTPPQHEHDIIEVTTYRTETGYSDHRRPDQVTFVTTLPEDLARRDFTINALAASIDQWLPSQNTSLTTLCTLSLVDPFDGFGDIQKKIIRAVGNPEQRFEEDALRIMRAIRFASELRLPTTSESTVNWHIDEATLDAIKSRHLLFTSFLLSEFGMNFLVLFFLKILLLASNSSKQLGCSNISFLNLRKVLV